MTEFTLPAEWRARRLPRRGSAGLEPWRPDPDAGSRAAAVTSKYADAVAGMIQHPSTDPAVRATEKGSAMAAGVEALATLHAANPADEEAVLDVVDGWLAGPGAAFAVEAVLTTVQAAVPWHRPSEPGWLVYWENHTAYDGVPERFVRRLRARLAAVDDATYGAALGALEWYRDQPFGLRYWTSVLAPDQAGWVAADVATAAGDPGGRRSACCQLLTSITDPGQADGLVGGWWLPDSSDAGDYAVTLVDGMGPAAVEVFGRLDHGYRRRFVDRPEVRAVLAELPGESAFGLLIGAIMEPGGMAGLVAAAERFPERALRMLAVAPDPAAPEPVRQRHAAVLRAVAVAHSEPAAGTRYAPESALPPALVSPPWTVKRRRAVPLDLRCDDLPTIKWEPGERERFTGPDGPAGPVWSAKLVGWIAHGEASLDDTIRFFGTAPEDVVRPLLESWPKQRREVQHVIVARFGMAVYDYVIAGVRSLRYRTYFDDLLPYCSPELALVMAGWLGRSLDYWQQEQQRTAEKWLARHAVAAARALIPIAVGGAPAAERKEAAATLQTLAADYVRTAAASYGPDAAAAVDALLAGDRTRPPKLPAWAAPALHTEVELADGTGTLPPDAVANLVAMLSVSTLDVPYPRLAGVLRSLDPASAGRFVWALHTWWNDAGAPNQQRWVLAALGLLGDDDTARRFAAEMTNWPGEWHGRVDAALAVFAAIGTDGALGELHELLRTAPKRIRGKVGAALNRVAADLGLTREQLADRLMPDFGLRTDGTRVLDYGPRRFVVGFDERLKPYVTDEQGKRRAALPKPAATDDPVLAAAARTAFTALKKDVRGFAGRQLKVLEQAMVTGRRYTPDEFARLAAHPLLALIVRRLVWLRYDADGRPVGGFRITEDGSPADADDKPVALTGIDAVAVAHPMRLADTLPAWIALFEDYALSQPFEQLNRDVYEVAGDPLPGYANRPTNRARLLGLRSRAWQLDDASGGRPVRDASRALPGGFTVWLSFTPGFGFDGWHEDQTVERVTVHHAENKAAGVADLDAVSRSELVRDLEAVVFAES